MAIIKNGFTRGPISNNIYSEHNGVQYVKGRSNKKKYKKSPATIDSATVFGKASRLSFELRQGIIETYNNMHDRTMSTRFTGAVVDSFQIALDETKLNFNFEQNSFRKLIGFEFNTNSPLSKQLFIQPVVTYKKNDRVSISLPEITDIKNLAFPKDILNCKIVLTCGLFDLENGFKNEVNSKSFDIKRTKPGEILMEKKQVSFVTQPGCLCLIGIAVKFYNETFVGDTHINSKQFNPCAILSTQITSGTIDTNVTSKWIEMSFKVGKEPLPTELPLPLPDDTAA
jgi:hypothetical protein